MAGIIRMAGARDGLIRAVALLLTCGAAFAQPASDTATSTSPGVPTSSIKLVRMIVGLPAGTPWITMRHGWLCAGPTTDTWTAGRVAQALPPYSDVFKTELVKAGYKVITPGEDNLFDDDGGSSDYEAAAVVVDQHIDGCMVMGSFLGAGPNPGDVKGDSAMKIDWQIYSPITKQVVAHISTNASAKLENSVPGGAARLVMESFAANVRELAANASFRTALNGPKPLTNGFVLPGQQDKIVLAGSVKAPKRQVSDAVGSVVTLVTSSGSGSGVLVSGDGFMLTNAHVVGDEKQVRVRWSDGIEKVAQVVRVAKDRDIALIKTDPREREPLAIKRGTVNPGQRVYAIGSPRGKEFQGTVSSGVISASRTIEGLRFIQSDVSVSPGSSGGALLDEGGSLIGITVARVDNAGPSGLNLFIPIGDAMDFLALEQQ